MRALAAATFLLAVLPGAARAQAIPEAPTRMDRVLYEADFSIRALDFQTTRAFLQSPCRCFREMDPIAPHTAAVVPQALFQFGLSSAVIFGSRELTKHHHPRWARALLLADIADEVLAVQGNERLLSAAPAPAKRIRR